MKATRARPKSISQVHRARDCGSPCCIPVHNICSDDIVPWIDAVYRSARMAYPVPRSCGTVTRCACPEVPQSLYHIGLLAMCDI